MPPPYTSIMMAGAGAIGQKPTLPLPATNLEFALDAMLTDSMYSDTGKTTVCNQLDGLACWEDQSDNGNDWTQPSAGNRPQAEPDSNQIYNISSNGQGPDDYLTGPDMSGWDEATFAARCYVSTALNGAIWGTTAWNDSGSLAHWSYFGTRYVNFGCTSRPGAGGADTTGTWITFEQSVTNLGVVTIRVNGSITYGPTDLGDLSLRTVPYLGCGVRSNTPQYSLGVYWHRVVGYSKTLTTAERTKVNTWLEGGVK